MALRDIFRKKKPKEEPLKPVEKPKEEIPLEKPVETKPKARKEKVKLETLPKSKKISELRIKKGLNVAYRTLKTPHITEKAGDLVKKNQYVFKIWPGANKIEIKKAIQDIYGVDVLDVRIIKISRKARRLGKQKGWREGYKKAIVKIKEGQKIEVLPR